jgi:hypothetical protein
VNANRLVHSVPVMALLDYAFLWCLNDWAPKLRASFLP